MISNFDVVEATRDCLQTVSAWVSHLEGSLDHQSRAVGLATHSANLCSPDDDHEAIESALSYLISAERQLQHLIPRAIAARNARRPSGRLPVELLRHIFEYYNEDSDYMHTRYAAYPALILASVCSQWRAAALGHGILWSFINLSDPSPLLDCLLGRVANHPLTVSCSAMCTDPRFEQHLEFLEANIRRIKDLTLRTDYPSLDLFEAVICTPAPALERCNISFIHSSTGSDASLQSPLFGGHTPQLRHLNIRNITSPWTSSFLNANFTTFVIHCHRMSAAEGVGIYHILEASPHLQVLDLSVRARTVGGDSAVLHPDSDTKPLRLSLQSLHTLKLRLPSSLIYHIVSSIHAPSVRFVDLDIGEVESNDPDIVERICRPAMLPLPLPRITGLNITVLSGPVNRPPILSIQGFSGAVRIFLLQWTRAIDYPDTDAQTVRAVLDIIRRQPGFALRTLTLAASADHADHPCDVIQQLPSVRCIIADSAAAPIVVRSICGAGASPAFAAALSNLEEITVKRCELDTDELLGLVDWYENRCKEAEYRLCILRVTQVVLKASTLDVAHNLLERLRNMEAGGLQVFCTDISVRSAIM